MKLNLGCGFNKLDGFINVDNSPICLPDLLLTLDKESWSWEDNSIDEVLLDHVLEHLGETTSEYIHVIKELYRVCKSGAKITIKVPHFRHENFSHDPTHVRAIAPEGLDLFNRQHNLEDLSNNGKASKLALMHGVDFQVSHITYNLEPRWQMQLNNNLITSDEMMHIMKSQNNVCYEVEIEMTVIKEIKNE